MSHSSGVRHGGEPEVTAEELQMIFAEATRSGVIEEEERVIMTGIMRLAERPVRELMTPRTEIDWIDKRATEIEIRARIKDPKVAARLVPQDHGFGTRRVPLESGYFEAYNRDNVHLVDTAGKGITEINAEGVVFEGRTYPVDVLIYASGAGDVLRFLPSDRQAIEFRYVPDPHAIQETLIPAIERLRTQVAATPPPTKDDTP